MVLLHTNKHDHYWDSLGRIRCLRNAAHCANRLSNNCLFFVANFWATKKLYENYLKKFF